VRLEQFRDGRILRLQTYGGAGYADLRETRAVSALAGDEGSAAGGAALLAVRVREAHPLVRDAIDVGRTVAHQSVAVAAQVRDPDVVPPDHEDVRLRAPVVVRLRHDLSPDSREFSIRSAATTAIG